MAHRIFRAPAVGNPPLVRGVEPHHAVHRETIDGAPGCEVDRHRPVAVGRTPHPMHRGIPTIEGPNHRNREGGRHQASWKAEGHRYERCDRHASPSRGTSETIFPAWATG